MDTEALLVREIVIAAMIGGVIIVVAFLRFHKKLSVAAKKDLYGQGNEPVERDACARILALRLVTPPFNYGIPVSTAIVELSNGQRKTRK